MAGNPLLLGAERRKIAGFRERGTFDPLSLFVQGEQGTWYDPSDLTQEKVSWRRNLLTWTQEFDNSAWTKSNASILSNLLTYSQDFDNAAWAKTSATVTANTVVAPDGTTTGDVVVSAAATAITGLYGSFSPLTATYTFSVYLKQAVAVRYVQILWTSSAVSPDYVNVDLQTGTVTGGSYAGATIAAASNGWYRVTLTSALAPIAGSGPWVIATTSGTAGRAPTYPGNGTDSFAIWGAQLVPGTTAQTYTATTAAAAAIQFSDPFGGTTADTVVAASGTSIRPSIFNSNVTTAAGVSVTASVYVQAVTHQFVQIMVNNQGSEWTNFTLTGSGIASANGACTASIALIGSGWYRLSMTYTPSGTDRLPIFVLSPNGTATRGQTWNPTGTETVVISAAQFEAASTASSYQRITDFTSDFLSAFPTHTLYQDSAGTTPVTALGQPLGLAIDKARGGLANLGAELVTNGTFSGGITGWSTIGATTTTDSEGVTLTNTGTNGRILQQLTFGANRTVAFSFTLYSGTLNAYLSLDGTATGSTTGNLTTPKRYTYIFTTTQANQWVAVYGIGAASTTMKVGNISVREVPGNHAIQPTSASRPVVDARVNLLTYSEQFDNAAWVKDRVTVTANATTAPDGTLTADKVLDTAVPFNTFRIYNNVTVGAAGYTFSVFAKAAEYSWCYLRIGTASRAWYNLSNGTIGVVDSGLTANIADAGNGWYKLSVSVTAIAGGSFGLVGLTTGNNVEGYAPTTGGMGIFVWGGDYRLATDTSLPYQRVVTASDYADVGAPRYLTFDGVDDSLYTASSVNFATWTGNETRRNLIDAPTLFDASYWVKNSVTVTANNAVAPDGTTTADTINSTAAATNYINSASIAVSASTSYTVSAYIKQGTSSATRLRVFDGGVSNSVASVIVSWSAGVPSINAQTGWSSTPTFTDVGNGWYRVVGTFSTGVYTTVSVLYYADAIALAGNNALLWGAQLELGTTATTFQNVGTDKVSVFTGVRKLSDAAAGAFAELSSAPNSTDGTFTMLAPGGAASVDYQFASRGTVQRTAIGTTYTAPITNVVTALSDIAGPLVQVRVNATAFSATSSQGTGNFSTQVLYIGRRNNASLPFNGRIYQLIVRGALSDTPTVTQTERWVASKTGVTL